jgi:hypothetical protein
MNPSVPRYITFITLSNVPQVVLDGISVVAITCLNHDLPTLYPVPAQRLNISTHAHKRPKNASQLAAIADSAARSIRFRSLVPLTVHSNAPSRDPPA